VALLGGDLEQAKVLHKECLVLSQELGDMINALEIFEGQACTAGAEGEAERAATLFGASQALRETIGFPFGAGHVRARRTLLGRSPRSSGGRRVGGGTGAGAGYGTGASCRVRLLGRGAPCDTPSTTGHSSLSSAPEHPVGLTSREVEVLGLVAEGLTNTQVA
jgi:hypothetical protein